MIWPSDHSLAFCSCFYSITCLEGKNFFFCKIICCLSSYDGRISCADDKCWLYWIIRVYGFIIVITRNSKQNPNSQEKYTKREKENAEIHKREFGEMKILNIVGKQNQKARCVPILSTSLFS